MIMISSYSLAWKKLHFKSPKWRPDPEKGLQAEINDLGMSNYPKWICAQPTEKKHAISQHLQQAMLTNVFSKHTVTEAKK